MVDHIEYWIDPPHHLRQGSILGAFISCIFSSVLRGFGRRDEAHSKLTHQPKTSPLKYLKYRGNAYCPASCVDAPQTGNMSYTYRTTVEQARYHTISEQRIGHSTNYKIQQVSETTFSLISYSNSKYSNSRRISASSLGNTTLELEGPILKAARS
jgi:hypothetical protein